jgi:hypothetical protein
LQWDAAELTELRPSDMTPSPPATIPALTEQPGTTGGIDR